MPRYFFHLRGPQVGQYICDSNGHALTDLGSVKFAAGRTAQALCETEMLKDWRGWNFDIVDEHGQLTLIYPIIQRRADATAVRSSRGAWFFSWLSPGTSLPQPLPV